jgi:predicted nucleic acid-binding protein
MPLLIGLDTSFIIALLDERDHWHSAVLQLLGPLETTGAKQFVFDCVLAEVVSTLARRTQDKRRQSDFPKLLDEIESRFPRSALTWVYPDLSALYDEVIGLVKEAAGELNFNDARIALACHYRGIPLLASFDVDFDRIAWLKRIKEPAEIADLRM